MYKKAQIGILSILATYLVFIILWGMFFADWLYYWASYTVTANNLTGVEAFLLLYINLWIGIFLFISFLVFMFYGANSQ